MKVRCNSLECKFGERFGCTHWRAHTPKDELDPNEKQVVCTKQLSCPCTGELVRCVKVK